MQLEEIEINNHYRTGTGTKNYRRVKVLSIPSLANAPSGVIPLLKCQDVQTLQIVYLDPVELTRAVNPP